MKLDALKPVLKGVIFVVDGSSLENVTRVAQSLYSLLVDPILTARRTPVFLAINKKDLLVDASSTTQEGDETSDPADEAVEQVAQRIEKALSVMQTHACPLALFLSLLLCLTPPLSALSVRSRWFSDKTRGLQSTMTELGSDGETRVRTLGREGEPFESAGKAHPCPACLSARSRCLLFSSHCCLAIAGSRTACVRSRSAAFRPRRATSMLSSTSFSRTKTHSHVSLASLHAALAWLFAYRIQTSV